jgi:mRNA interferase MazF
MAHDPDRGDILLLDLSPQAGEHRIIVLSERAFSVATGWVVGCPITTKIKGSPFEVRVRRGLKTVGCVVASELRTMDYIARRARLIERAPLDLLQNVQAIACATIGCT